MNNTIKRRKKIKKKSMCLNPKVSLVSGDIPLGIDVSKIDQAKIECKRLCEKFDSCSLIQIGQPNNPSECTEFYNEDLFRQFYDSKEEILVHIKSFGYIPNIINDDNNNFDIDINISGDDGKPFPLFVRHYFKDGDRWEFMSQDFYEFGEKITTFGGSRELVKSAMK